MKTNFFGIRALAVSLTLILFPLSLMAWQLGGPADDEKTTIPSEDAVGLGDLIKSEAPSSDQSVPIEHRDSAFVWNIVERTWRNQRNERDEFHLSEEQTSKVNALFDAFTRAQLELSQRRDVADSDDATDNERSQTLRNDYYARMAKFREDLMALLTDTQRDDVYRRTLRNGGAFALLHPELRTRFQLTEEQIHRITEIRDSNWETLSPHFMTATDAHNRAKAEPLFTAAFEPLNDDQKIRVQQFLSEQIRFIDAENRDHAAAAREYPNGLAPWHWNQNRFDPPKAGIDVAAPPGTYIRWPSPGKREMPGFNHGALAESNDASVLESGIARLGEELQSLNAGLETVSDSADPNRQTRERKEAAIRSIVEQAFDMRQQLQRLETQRIRLRLDAIERNLEARENSRERIIQQRIEELLGQKTPATRSGDAANAIPRPNHGPPVTSSAVGLPGPPHIPISGPAELPNNVGVAANFAGQWQRSHDIVKELRFAMRNVADCQDKLSSARRDVERWSQPLAELKSQNPVVTEEGREFGLRKANDSLTEIERDIEFARRDLNHVWSSYQSQLRLFQLDVAEAQENFQSLTTKQQRLEQLVEKNVVPTSELEETTAARAIALIRLQRAEEILRNYAEIEKLEQELKPDSLQRQ